MSIGMRVAWRVGVCVAVIGAATAAVTVPANADSIVYDKDVACYIHEQIELQGSPTHDHMSWYTDGNSDGCTAGIRRFNNGTWTWADPPRTITTNGPDGSDPYLRRTGLHQPGGGLRP